MPLESRQLFNLSLHFSDGYDELSGESSPVRPSSPDGPALTPPTRQELLAVIDPSTEYFEGEDREEDYDSEYTVPNKRKVPQTLDSKISGILDHMHMVDGRLSMHQFISGVFKSNNPSTKKSSGRFYSENSHINIMDLWWMQNGGMQDVSMVEWIMDRAAEICNQEASFLTNQASKGPYNEVAEYLHPPSSKINVDTVDKFQLKQLQSTYDQVTPNFQKLLKAFTTSSQEQDFDKRRDFGQVMITSMALNMRSMKTNYHQAINSLIFWDNRVSKRLVQMLNQLGVCSSYPFQIKAVKSLSWSATQVARKVANDPLKIKMLPYDNFNWMTHAWETSALHKSQTHDEVSALLVILPTPPGEDAHKITSIGQFKEKSRHNINPITALSDILPSNGDQVAFRKNAAIHIQNILAELFVGNSLNKKQLSIPSFNDDNAINPIKTEEYYLPTFDQEQGSTQGNMIVLEHYFQKVLAIPKKTFEDTIAAQDQRTLDLSPDTFDHLSSICTVGGLMHYEMNFISAIAGNFWGSEKNTDAVSLSTLHKLFPSRTDVNSCKINYYAWLQFLEVVLHALVLKAAMKVTSTSSLNELSSYISSNTTCLEEIATSIMRQFVTSPTRLEGLQIKKLPNDTLNGHAVLLFHNILTL
ncbi:hypothetical protein BDQ17DRAFT_1429042 [Cyathus striatus]|nr:hypothetical protein BDQ17DRAFT_1429042 [Cyathus striatus]